MKPTRYWQDMTTEEFGELDPGTIAILPVAAIEQHGPHLPVYVDACVNAGVIARALELLPERLPVTVLPAMPVGKSNEHLAFPGTLTLSAETLIRLWTEIGESVARAGVRKLVLFNSHGGQPQVMDIVARDLRVRLEMFVVTASSYSLAGPGGDFDEQEIRHGIHGGAIETSMMMHLRPDLVKTDKADNFVPASVAMEAEYDHLRPEGGIGFGWQAQDIHPSGAVGNARDADAERGKRLVENAATGLVALLEEVDRYPLENVRARPS
ncbi:MAG: creatininase family protein [Alphaproteobacteria bacterium]|nr:creatininase family protein [Alphaproteobacteria bacterium]